MDGASKFVRGDAVAAIIVTLVNAIGGIVIGTLRHGLDVSHAATLYTTLTIGDGIVSQIPALIVSLGAGMLVSKGSVRGSTHRTFVGQLGGHSKPLFLASGLAGAVRTAARHAVPALRRACPPAAGGGRCWCAGPNDGARVAASGPAARSEENVGGPKDEPLGELMKVDEIRIELGMGLVPLTTRAGRRPDRENPQAAPVDRPRLWLRAAIGAHPGQRRSRGRRVRVAGPGVEIARETMMMGRLLAFSTGGRRSPLAAYDTKEPSFRIAARWIELGNAPGRDAQGLTVVDVETVLTTHLSETAKAHMSQLMSYSATQKLWTGLPHDHQKLVQDLVPGLVPMTTVQKVLAGLLAERVSIRHLPLVLEAIHEAAGMTRNVRHDQRACAGRLAMQICKSLTAATASSRSCRSPSSGIARSTRRSSPTATSGLRPRRRRGRRISSRRFARGCPRRRPAACGRPS